jgi:hypothetical protein
MFTRRGQFYLFIIYELLTRRRRLHCILALYPWIWNPSRVIVGSFFSFPGDSHNLFFFM